MIKAAKDFGFQVPTDFIELFKTHLSPDFGRTRQCLQESEKISLKMAGSIIKFVKKLLTEKDVFYEKSPNFDDYKQELLSIVPISSAKNLADVTNAAWEVYFDDNKWSELKHLSQAEKFILLNELTIKSFEILEINHRISL